MKKKLQQQALPITTTTAISNIDSTPSFQFIIKYFIRIQNTLSVNVFSIRIVFYTALVKLCVVVVFFSLVGKSPVHNMHGTPWQLSATADIVCAYHFIPSHNIQTYIILSASNGNNSSNSDRIIIMDSEHPLNTHKAHRHTSFDVLKIYFNASAVFSQRNLSISVDFYFGISLPLK